MNGPENLLMNKLLTNQRDVQTADISAELTDGPVKQLGHWRK